MELRVAADSLRTTKEVSGQRWEAEEGLDSSSSSETGLLVEQEKTLYQADDSLAWTNIPPQLSF